MNQLELSQKDCHVCGHPLEKDLKTEKEWCDYKHCVLRGIKFNIPYIATEKVLLLDEKVDL